jgi:hypothetical protein
MQEVLRRLACPWLAGAGRVIFLGAHQQDFKLFRDTL